MMLRRWDPFRELRHMDEDIIHAWPRWFFPTDGEDTEDWTIPLDVFEKDDKMIIRATMPGMKPEDIDVTVAANVVTIKGKTEIEKEHEEDGYLIRERRAGVFHRTLRLPQNVDTDKAETTYDHGVLTIAFPLLEAKKAKRLPITVGGVLMGEKK